ncbi:MAG: hypothetical protein RR585_08915 [Coprobacillus sp.]
MKRLIVSELKKLFKSKSICFVVVGFMLLSIFVSVACMGEDANHSEYMNMSGEKVNLRTTLQDANDNMHKYAGEWTLDKGQQIKKDALDKLNQLSMDAIDIDKMKDIYGDKYQTVIDMYQGKIVMEDKEIGKFLENLDIDQFRFVSTLNGENRCPEVYFRDTAKLNYLLIQYGYLYYSIHDIEFLKNGFPIAEVLDDVLLDKKIDKQEFDRFEKEKDLRGRDAELFEAYINEKVEALPTEFDSEISKDMFVENIGMVFFIATLVIIVVIANIFGIERQYNVEQIIYPTQSTKFKITIAKIITSFIVSLGILWGATLLFFISFYIILPPYNWNTMFLSTDMLSYIFTYQEVMISGFVLASLSALVVTTLSLLLSYLTKNRFVVVIVLFSLVALSWGMIGNGNMSLFLPVEMSLFTFFFSSGQGWFPYVFINDSIVSMRTIVTIGWSLIIIFITSMIIFHSRKSYIRS